MKVEVIPRRVKPDNIEKLQADVAVLERQNTENQQAITELREKVEHLEQQIKPVET